LENVSATGALITTEFGIRPATNIAVETLPAAPGLRSREFAACIVRHSPGETAIEWADCGSTDVFDMLTEVIQDGAGSESELPALGRVRFCALSAATFG
jgi:hypothetical protein